MAEIQLTDEQLLFIDTALLGNNILVNACVGSGKTTAIQQLCNVLPKDKSVLYLTYNRLLKVDAKQKIKNENVQVTNYHGFAYKVLKENGKSASSSDCIQVFLEEKPPIINYDILIMDEYQDIDLEISKLLEYIKSQNPSIQIIAVGDMAQKIYDKTTLTVPDFIKEFLGYYTDINFTKCFRLNEEHAALLGRIWNKTIIGVNESQSVEIMTPEQVVPFLSQHNTDEILCLGKRAGIMTSVLNRLETDYPEKFNKKTVYASIVDKDAAATEPKGNSAIFTTFDSSKGLERKICVIFDYTEENWDYRAHVPDQKYEILKNIFCVAASRGKEKIIFVGDKEKLLTEKTISTPVQNTHPLRNVGIRDMFDFKYKENIEKRYSMLNISEIETEDQSEIDIKSKEGLIDLSPCIGNYQEADFFKNYSIAMEIEFFLLQDHINREYYNSTVKDSSTEAKILYLTSLETKQKRYTVQVPENFVNESAKAQLRKRLREEFTGDETVQKFCILNFDHYGTQKFMARGFADVIKNDTVYELKFVSELMHEHFLQCACYIAALNLPKGILWNTRTNEKYEITIPDKESFLYAVAQTATKRSNPEIFSQTISKQMPILETADSDNIAVIDTETNLSDKLMSIGLVIADAHTYDIVKKEYYIIMPEASAPSIYGYSLNISCGVKPLECNRADAMASVINTLKQFNIKAIFAYNADFDKRILSELSYFLWFDIMKIAAYRQFNNKITADMECFSTGRLKRNYGVEAITNLLTDGNQYIETHNAICDAIDQLNIMRMLNQPIEVYYANAGCQSDSNRKHSVNKAPKNISQNPQSQSKQAEDALEQLRERLREIDNKSAKSNESNNENSKGAYAKAADDANQNFSPDEIDSKEAAEMLGVSKSKIYELIKYDRISAYKKGNKYVISKASVEEYQEKKMKALLTGTIVAAIGALIPILALLYYLIFVL
ncbi:MAG: AAA family ATPase [Clostridiales bacterium]|nr:AAA family ATPase [Candidatus Equinaster intestinalis]